MHVVQMYRECRNTILSSITQLTHALVSITRQREALEEAHRTQSCFSVQSSSSTVSLPPLGVLTLFSPCVTEQLMAQQAADQSALLSAVFSAKQKWTNRVRQIAQQIDKLETAAQEVVDRGGERDDDAMWMEPADALRGLYGLLAAVSRMETTLQEVMIALRKDFQQSCFDAGEDRPAYAMSFLLNQEEHTESTMCSALQPRAASSYDPLACMNAPQPPRLLTFCDAVEAVHAFLTSRWEEYEKQFLCSTSHILLSA